MGASGWARTISVTASYQPLSDTPLILRAQILIWSVAGATGPLDLLIGGFSAQLANNRDFMLDGVDLSTVSVKGDTNYRVTVIGTARQGG